VAAWTVGMFEHLKKSVDASVDADVSYNSSDLMNHC